MMNLFSKLNANRAAQRLSEEQLYNFVHKELEEGIRRNGLWTKAISLSDGQPEKAKSCYIKLRVQSLKDDKILEEEVKSEIMHKRKNSICEKCGVETKINYGDAYNTYCKSCI